MALCNEHIINLSIYIYRSIFEKNTGYVYIKYYSIYIYCKKKYLNQNEPNTLANSNISWNSPCRSKVLKLLRNSCCQKYQGFLLVAGYHIQAPVVCRKWQGLGGEPGNPETSSCLHLEKLWLLCLVRWKFQRKNRPQKHPLFLFGHSDAKKQHACQIGTCVRWFYRNIYQSELDVARR